MSTIGLKPARVDTCRKAISDIKNYLSGKDMGLGDKQFRMKTGGRNIPIYLAVAGPRMLQLSGEICDGAIALLGITRESLEYANCNIKKGLEEAGRRKNMDNFDLALGTYCYFTDDMEKGVQVAEPYCLSDLQRYPDLFKLNGIAVGERPNQNEESVYPDLAHAEDWNQAVSMASKKLNENLLREYAEKFCIIGKPKDALRRFEELVSLGINNFYIRHFFSYDLPENEVRIFNESIIPCF